MCLIVKRLASVDGTSLPVITLQLRKNVFYGVETWLISRDVQRRDIFCLERIFRYLGMMKCNVVHHDTRTFWDVEMLNKVHKVVPLAIVSKQLVRYDTVF